jgi:hypothetical protein
MNKLILNPIFFSFLCVLLNWNASKCLERGEYYTSWYLDGALLIIFISLLIAIRSIVSIYKITHSLDFSAFLKTCQWYWILRLWPFLIMTPMLVKWKLSTEEVLQDGTKSIVAFGYGSNFSFMAMLFAFLAIALWEIESIICNHIHKVH